MIGCVWYINSPLNTCTQNDYDCFNKIFAVSCKGIFHYFGRPGKKSWSQDFELVTCHSQSTKVRFPNSSTLDRSPPTNINHKRVSG